MDNPHQETQALLLTRIIKTVEKCNEAMKALNGHLADTLDTEGAQDIIVAARLFEHYNRNVAYNLERMEAEGAKEKESKDAAAAATALAGSVKKD